MRALVARVRLSPVCTVGALGSAVSAAWTLGTTAGLFTLAGALGVLAWLTDDEETEA